MAIFKTCLILLLCVFFVTNGVNAKWSFGGRGSSRSSGRTTSRSGSYGRGSSVSSAPSHRPISHRPISHVPTGSHTPSIGKSYPQNLHPTGHASGGTSHTPSKDINTSFLKGEGGGANRPVQKNPPTSFGSPYPPSAPTSTIGHLPSSGRTPGIATESRQTSAFQPSAPSKDHIMKSNTNTLQSSNVPYTPGQSTTGQTHPSWSNPYLGVNRPAGTSQTNPLNTNYPGSHPPPTGFKDHVYPQNHPISTNPQYSSPQFGGHPPYPSYTPPSSHWSTPPHHYSSYQPNTMPMGNPYSVHPSGSAYSTSGQTHYPQQPHVLAQPAAQPFVPGQTVIMVPGQQDSGRGFGQLVKEALVYSTINAGVNRLINPHTHTHTTVVESKPDTPTTHITYNNQYFNTAPGVSGTASPVNIPQGSSPGSNFPAVPPNPDIGGTPSMGTGSTYINTPSNRMNNPTSGTVGGVVPGTTVTATAQSNTPNSQVNETNNASIATNTISYRISDDDLFKITEDLFSKNTFNASKYVKLNLQSRVDTATSANVTDQAKEPLFDVEPELLDYPSVYVTRSLYDRYEHDSRKKFNRTLETREQENLLIDTFLNTNVMATSMQWLADRGFIDPDDFERKDVLRRLWFTVFSGSTCGFERVFASENYDTAILGVQDWTYFEHEESLKRINYMGYVDKLSLGSTASLLKLNFEMDGMVRPNATIFVGTLPELEMSLYTICFYARPNDLCPVSLGGTKFNIYTHTFTYFGNDIIDLALPVF